MQNVRGRNGDGTIVGDGVSATRNFTTPTEKRTVETDKTTAQRAEKVRKHEPYMKNIMAWDAELKRIEREAVRERSLVLLLLIALFGAFFLGIVKFLYHLF